MKFRNLVSINGIGATCLLAALALGPTTSVAQAPKMTFAVPGIPPVFAGVIAMVADKEGFFKKHGVDVDVRAFETGAAASRAVASGEIAMALAPSPLVVSQVSNSDVKLIGIYGLEHPDWLIGSTDPNASCQTIKGQAVGVDAVGGARSIALKTMLIGGCHMKIDDVQQVALSSNVAPAMVAGQIKYGALHIDDVAVLEAQTGKPIKTVVTQKTSRPLDHYMLVVVNEDKLAQNRDAYVRAVAGLIDAERFMRNPANAAKVAQDAKPTGHSIEQSENALKAYLAMTFWPNDTDGLTEKNLELVGKVMKNVGNIKPDKQVAPYDRIADPSVWRDAMKMVRN